ncbi:H(+)/Cl(-) exchange transporter ClcA [Francisellaceae bacterium]|nr:H(+)/Cl(-) exchange transporter ClcA [Francisellaceae bacterium]
MSKTIHNRHEVTKLVLLGAIVGLLVGSIGAVFQIVIIWIGETKGNLIAGISYPILQYFLAAFFSTLFLVSAIFLVRKVAPETAGSGVQEIEGILEGKRTMRWYLVLPTKFLAGVLSLSSGLVLGREGPTIQMGGAVGKMLQTIFRLNAEYTHILIAAGAGAGLAAAFNAPLAGILFVVEEMRHQFKYSFKSLQVVIIACVCSDIMLRLFMGQSTDIPMMHFATPKLSSLWVFIILGVLFGGLGVIFNKYLVKSLNFFMMLPKRQFWAFIIAIGAGTGILSIAYPNVIGGGYAVIPTVLQEHMGISALLILFVLRLLTTWTSYGTGATGGIFAPMLALGTIFGVWFGMAVTVFFPDLVQDPAVFAVAGMSALFTATVGAPLTGIVLVVEMTMNYSLILPLILTCFSATIAAHFFGGRPIYSTLLGRTLVLAHRKALYFKLLKRKRSEL